MRVMQQSELIGNYKKKSQEYKDSFGSTFLAHVVIKVTACNNEGELVFEYNLEDTDIINGSYVFNGQTSVLWNNVRVAFADDIAAMYRNLRNTSRYFNYEYVKTAFEEHQLTWPERIWNEDAYIKYLAPFLIQGTNNLEMLQGSKASQRDWWLYNAFKYWDSKYQATDSEVNRITLRIYASGDIDITPYSHIYARLKYGSHTVIQRAERNQTVTLESPFDETESANDTETYIYSADRIAQIGDLSQLQVGYADFSYATKLQTLKLGDGAASYSNEKLSSVTVGSNELLTSLDVRNCPNLSTAIDLTNCTSIEEVYATGTSVTNVNLPTGGHLHTLTLPNTITTLWVRDQAQLSTFSIAGYNYLQSLRIENTPNIPIEAIVNGADNLQYVRLIGVEWTAASEASLTTTIRRLEECNGLAADNNSTIVDDAVIYGRVNIASISSDLLTEINTYFPNLTVVVDGVPQYTVRFVNYDNTVLYTEVIPQGSNAYNPVPSRISAPTRPNDDDGLRGYIFNSWTSIPTNVQANMTVTPAWRNTWRVRYLDDDSTVLQSSMVVNGGTATYTGNKTPSRTPTPQYSYTHSGWTNADGKTQTNITSACDFMPTFTATTRVYSAYFYNGSTLVKSVTNKAYNYQLTSSDIPSYSSLTDPQGRTGYTCTGWQTNDGVAASTSIRLTDDYYFYAVWVDQNSPLVKYLKGTMTEYDGNATTFATYSFYNMSTLTSAKAPATVVQTNAFQGCSNLTTVDLTNTSSAVTIQAQAFNALSKLEFIIIHSGSIATLANTNAFTGTKVVLGEGGVYVPAVILDDYKAATNWSTYASNIYPIDAYPVTDYSTISDDWDTIVNYINAGQASSLYKVGDTKIFTDTDGKSWYLQLAAFNADLLASDTSQTAATTWIMKKIYDRHVMNSTATTIGGYDASSMKTWLNDTVFNKLPDIIKNNVKTVQKTSWSYSDSSTTELQTTNEKIWIPSSREMNFTGNYLKETSGPIYSGLFSTAGNSADTKRVKYESNDSAYIYWTRSANSSATFVSVSDSGYASSNSASNSLGAVFGICI